MFELHLYTFIILTSRQDVVANFINTIKSNNETTREDRADVVTIILFKLDKCPVIYERERV